MNEDLMSTQTGGEGQTIQAMPDTSPTPADFSANINPQQVQNPPVKVPTVEQTAGAPQVQIPNQEAQSATSLIQPTNENVTQMPTEQPEETKVDVPEGYTDEWYNEITNPPVTQQETTTVTEEETKQPVETINGVKPFTIKQEEVVTPQVVAPVEKQVQQKPVETINGVKPFTVKPEVSPEEQKVQKEYKKAGINVQPLEKKQNFKYGKEDRDYTFDGRIYRKQDGNWLVYNKTKDAFVKFDPRTDVKGRYAVLEKKAVPYKKPESLGIASSVLKQSIGDITGEIPQAMQTNGLGMNMEMLNRSAMGTSDMERNFDGTKNFNYDPNVAQASKGAQGLLTYKPEVKKEPKKIKVSELPNVITDLNSINTVRKFKNALETEKKLSSDIKEQKRIDYRTSVLDQANNFANKNIALTVGNSLTPEQTENLIEQQNQVKSFLGLVDSTPQAVNTIKEKLDKTNQFLIEAQKNNAVINQAAREGKSFNRYLYDVKKDKINEINDELVVRTFNATSGIADYINKLEDAGKVRYDKSKGRYVYSENLPKSEKAFHDAEFKKLNSEYNNSQKEEQNYIYQTEKKFRDEKFRIESEIKGAQNQLLKIEKGSDEYNKRLSFIEERKKHLLYTQSQIDDLEGRKLAVLRTDGKAVVKNIAGAVSDYAKDMYSAIPKGISPKAKFDLYYNNLLERQKILANQNNIETGYFDKLALKGKDLLDWEYLGVKLSKAEKEYLQNQSQINQLAPIFFNNTTGITKSTDGFFSSFWSGYNNFLFPNTSKAVGQVSQTEQAGTIANTLKEIGISEDDLVDENKIKELEQRAASNMLSLSGVGQTLGTSAAIITAMEASPSVGFILKAGKGLFNLATAYTLADKSKKVIDAGTKLYNRTLKSGKYGKFFAEAAEQGAKAELAGGVYGSTGSELNATIGVAGVVGSELMGGIISKLPKGKVLPYLSSIFGSSTPQAVSVLGRAGQFVTTGTAETAGEIAEELAGIYTDENRKNGFFDAVKQKFPDFNSVQEFVTSTMIMGGMFNLTQPNKARELYDSLSEKEREEVNNVVSDVNDDFQEADDAVNDFATEVQNVEEGKKAVDKTEEKKEEKKETKVEPEGEDEIIFDVGDLSTIEPETEITEELPVESTFTQPIDLTNDKENEQGVSGKVGEGEKPVETEPVAKPSEEETSPSGVVQEEQKITVNPSQGYSFTYSSKEDVPAELKDVTPINESTSTIGRGRNAKTELKLTFSGQQLIDAGLGQEEQVVPKVYSDVEKITENSYVDKVSNNSIDKKGKNWIVSQETTGEVYHTSKSLEDAIAWQESENEIVGRTKEQKTEEKPTETKSEEGLTPEETEGRDEIVKSKGTITTTKPARIFKGLFGKKNPDGTVRTAHPDVKGTWGALDKKLAEKYRENEDEVLKEFEIPAGTTVETIEIPMKGLTLDQYRKLETDAINNSSAQVVKLITKDATARMQTQMVIKDAAISGYKAKETSKKAEVIAKKMVDGKEALNAAEQSYLMDNQDEVQSAIDKIESTQKAETTQTTSNAFTDLKAVNKHGIRSAKRREAIADFDAKHGEGAYNRVSKIDANFDSIINKLEKNNLIEKEC